MKTPSTVTTQLVVTFNNSGEMPMQINLTGHHIEVTDSLRDYVKEKMARLERHFDKVSN